MHMIKDAVIDPTGKYRYSLSRIWDSNLPKVLFVMLNPSTADSTLDDPTIRRCIGFAKLWGFGSLEVVNLFGLRATNPNELRDYVDPVGHDNDAHILLAAGKADKIIVAWGTKGSLYRRDKKVMSLLYSRNPYCLDITKDNHPKHPLYIRADCDPKEYSISMST